MIKIDIVSTGSKGNCNVIYDGEIAIMLDCGIDVERVRRYFMKKGEMEIFNAIKYLVVTHTHKDHSKSIDEWRDRLGDEYILAQYELDTPVETQMLDDAKFIPFPINHDVVNFGYDIVWHGRKICWFTDSATIPTSNLKNHHVYLVEANHTDEMIQEARLQEGNRYFQYYRHLSTEKLGVFLEETIGDNVQEVFCLHTTTNRKVWGKSLYNVGDYITRPLKIRYSKRNFVISAIEPFAYYKVGGEYVENPGHRIYLKDERDEYGN